MIIVYSPEGKTVPKKQYSSILDAQSAAKAMAEVHKGQTFYVMVSEYEFKVPDETYCVVKDCHNCKSDGRFVGYFCLPCYQFLTEGQGNTSQAYRNALATAARKLNETD